MEITMTNRNQTPSMQFPASGFAMSTCGQVRLGAFAERIASIPATGLIGGTDVRDRKGLAVQGHVALAAYVPGHPAWSPPIC